MSPVIINDFELVPAAPSATAEGEPNVAEEQQANNPPSYSPVLAIESVLRRCDVRLLRVWAH